MAVSIFSRDWGNHTTRDHGIGPAISFLRSSIATEIGPSRLMRTLGVNEMRVNDHDPATGKRLGFLSEITAVNSARSPEAFNNTADWVRTNIANVFTNNTTAPDGTLTVDRVEDANFGGFGILTQTIGGAAPGATETVTVSLYFKKDNVPRSTRHAFIRSNFSGGVTKILDLPMDTMVGETFPTILGSGPAPLGGGVIDAGDFWRLWGTFQNNNTGNDTLKVTIFPANGTSAAMTSFSSSAVGAVNIWGAQVVRNASANDEGLTSYIPGATPGGIRGSDSAWVDLSGRLQGGATVVATFVKGDIPGTYFAMDDGSFKNRLMVVRTSNGSLKFKDRTDSIENISEDIDAADGDEVTVAFSAAPNDYRVTINGTALKKSTVTGPAQFLKRLCIMNGSGSGNQPNSTMTKIECWDGPVSDDMLIELGKGRQIPDMILDTPRRLPSSFRGASRARYRR